MQRFHKAQRGFTLIETMVTITVMAVLLGLAVPNFITTVRNNRLIAQNNELIGSLNYARSEALKRGGMVSVCASADQLTCSGDTNWTPGWIVFADPNSNGDLDGTEEVIQAQPAAPPEFALSSTNQTFVSFGSSGMSSNAEIFDLVRVGCVGPHARRVDLSVVGRVSTSTVACP